MGIFGEHPARNISVFFIGTVISAIGAVMSTNSVLGVSPSSAIPYVCNMSFGFSLGICTYVIQAIFFVLGFIIMGRKNYKAIFLLCVPTLLIYGGVMDIVRDPLSSVLCPDNYAMEWILIIIATAVHAFGIALQLASNLSMTPLDMFANFLACRTGREYGILKMCIDVALVAIAAVMSFFMLGELKGVREGTLFAAVFVGLIVRWVSKIFVRCGFYDWVGRLKIEFRKNDYASNKE